MADILYAGAIDDLLKGDLDLVADDIRALLVKPTYTPLVSHGFLSSISAGDRIGSAVALGSKSVVAGVYDAADTTFASVAAGSTAQAVVLYRHTGSDATARLVAYIDAIENFPVATNGADLLVAWDNGPRKILALFQVS